MMTMQQFLENEKLYLIAWVLVIIGGVNWLFIGLANFNIVAAIFGVSFLARLIYIIIGVAACYLVYVKIQKRRKTVV